MATTSTQKPTRTLYVLLALILAIMISPALTLADITISEAQELNGAITKDTFILEGTPAQNNGANDLLKVKTATQDNKILMQFDVSGIPSDAVITSASVTLYREAGNDNGEENVSIYRVTKAWDEGAGNAQNSGDGATWDNATNATTWTTAGGDYGATEFARTPVTVNGYYAWDITTLVQGWINGTWSNNGFLLVNPIDGEDLNTFTSSDDSIEAQRPIFNISYSTPPRWSSQAQNDSNPAQGNAVLLSTFWDDNSTLSHAWLSTNESGSWNNYSLTAISGSSNWSNFTWNNSTVPVGTLVGWRIYANNTNSQSNVTSTLAFTIASPPDTTPPASVTSLGETSAGQEWINWGWTNPADADFSEAIVYIDNVNVANTSSASYNATGLACNTSHNITVHTKDTSGNVNSTDVTDAASTSDCLDVTPPGSVTGLGESSTGQTWIYWQWTSPADVDFDEAVIYVDDVNVANSSSASYNATGFSCETSHTIKIHTKDTSGNVNNTDVSDAAVTAACSDTTSPVITNISANNIDTDSANISWDTDEAANSSVNYGTTSALGTIEENAALETAHSMALSGLNDDTTYLYNITSCDSAGNCNTTGPYNFTTDASGSNNGGGGGGNDDGGAANFTESTTVAAKNNTGKAFPAHLFDVALELRNTNLTSSGALVFFVELLNVGENKNEALDVQLSYVVINSNGTTVFQQTETRAVLESLSYKKTLTDFKLSPGDYTLKIIAAYGSSLNQTAAAEHSFTITEDGALIDITGAAVAQLGAQLLYPAVLLMAVAAIAITTLLFASRSNKPKNKIAALVSGPRRKIRF